MPPIPAIWDLKIVLKLLRNFTTRWLKNYYHNDDRSYLYHLYLLVIVHIRAFSLCNREDCKQPDAYDALYALKCGAHRET